jgi:hypothetical protein
MYAVLGQAKGRRLNCKLLGWGSYMGARFFSGGGGGGVKNPFLMEKFFKKKNLN